MLEQLNSGVNWAAVFYLITGIGCLIILDRALGISFPDFFRIMFREFRWLATRPISQGSINAVTILTVGAICMFYFVLDPVRHALQLVGGHGHSNTVFEFIAVIVLVGAIGLMSARLVGPPK